LKTYETQNNYDKNCSGKKRNGKNILKTRKLFTKYSNCSLDTKPINEPRNESAQKKKGKSLKEYFERWFDKMLETEKGVLEITKVDFEFDDDRFIKCLKCDIKHC
jgi:hypothetical protein